MSDLFIYFYIKLDFSFFFFAETSGQQDQVRIRTQETTLKSQLN